MSTFCKNKKLNSRLALVLLVVVLIPNWVWADPQKLVPILANNETPLFGESIAAGNGLLAIGAQSGFGTSAGVFGYVDIFQRDSSGWALTTTLHPVDTRNFGSSLAMNGNWMAVVSLDPVSFQPLIDMFHYQGNAWSVTQRIPGLIPSPNLAGLGNMYLGAQDLFLQMKYLSPEDDPLDSRVYTFHYDGQSWVGPTQVVAPYNGIEFGASIAQNDDRLVISDSLAAIGADAGAVYTFVRNAGQWVHLDTLVPQSITGLAFGGSLAFCGARLAIGSTVPYYASTGAAQVQLYNSTTLGWNTFNAPISIANPPLTFAQSLACTNNVLAISAPASGSAYRVLLSPSGNFIPQVLTTIDPASKGFNKAIAVSQNDVIVGDPQQGAVPGVSSGIGAVYGFLDDVLFSSGFE